MRRIVCTLIVAALPFGAIDVAAQDSSAVQADPSGGKKSPATARALGVVPGLGHFYAGETGRGFLYLTAPAVVLAGGSLLILLECVGDVADTADDTCPSPILENAVVLGVFAVWGWSIYDAGRAAHRANARRGRSVSPFVRPQGMPGAAASHTMRLTVGVTLSGW